MNDKTKKEKIKFICESNHISISTLMRLFNLTYPQAEIIIQDLLNKKIVLLVNNAYNIASKTQLNEYLNKKM